MGSYEIGQITVAVILVILLVYAVTKGRRASGARSTDNVTDPQRPADGAVAPPAQPPPEGTDGPLPSGERENEGRS